MEKIQTTGVSDQFKAHLSDVNNQRIIFSGSFGSGKTTFLNDFFKTKEQSDKYYVCKLFPVNYVTSDNKDIYELMKFDILLQLLGSEFNVTLEESDFDKLSTLSKSVKKNSLKLLQSIMGIASSIDGRATILSKAVDAIATIYKQCKKEEPKTKVDEFLADLENQVGSSYEMNDISKLISDMLIKARRLNKQEENEDEKETVLLIDDFDRLEPMQSFRLLNILSTNDNEAGTSENKFGFDKIIIVCDIGNLRDCFAHINGTSNAFNGYIDKFYSTQIFNFDIKKDIVKAINVWLYEINIRPIERHEFSEIFSDVIKRMVSCGGLNIRSLTKMQDIAVNIPSRIVDRYDTTTDYIGLFFSVLQKMFVGDQEVSNAIHLCYKQNPLFLYNSNNIRVISEILFIMHPGKKNNEEIELLIDEKQYLFKIQVLDGSFRWELISVNREPFLPDSSVPVLYFIEEIKRRYLNI